MAGRGDQAWADAADLEGAEALDGLRRTMGRVPTERERAAFLGAYREGPQPPAWVNRG